LITRSDFSKVEIILIITAPSRVRTTFAGGKREKKPALFCVHQVNKPGSVINLSKTHGKITRAADAEAANMKRSFAGGGLKDWKNIWIVVLRCDSNSVPSLLN